MSTTSLRILQTCFSQSWGGLELQALEVSAKLAQKGHRIWLACPPDSRLHREATASGLDVLPLPVSGYVHPSIVWKLHVFLGAHRPDIIHCQLSRDIATVVPAMRLSLRRTPLVLSKRVGSFLGKRDLFHRFTYASVSRVLAISSVIRRNVIDTTPVPPERVVTLYDAVNTELFSPGREHRNEIRREFGFDDSMVVVGFVGRFSQGKGHEELLSAADTIRKKRENVRFLVVGEASYGEEPYERRIRSSAHAMGLEAVVTFAGFRKDVPAVMSAFDLLAFPSHAESFGVVLIEAMATGLAVVSTNCDGVLDIVVNGETGLFVHPRNAAELSNALLRLIDSADLRATMGAAGRKRVLELFDQRLQIEQLERIYLEVLQESSASTRQAAPSRVSGSSETPST